jgi:Family of unknown function (DUF6522)
MVVKSIEFEGGVIQIDASIVAEGLGMRPPLLLEQMREGTITSLCERGTEADHGRHRLTFFSGSRRFRLVVDESGAIVERSAIDFGGRPLPGSAHRPGG